MTIFKKNKCPDFYPCADGTFSTKKGKGSCSSHGGMLVFNKKSKKVKAEPVKKQSPVTQIIKFGTDAPRKKKAEPIKKQSPVTQIIKFGTDAPKKFKPGDKWSDDFDYEGMLKYSLKVNVFTPIETLNKLFDSAEDVNFHKPYKYLWDAIVSLKAYDEVNAKKYIQKFHKDIEKELNPSLYPNPNDKNTFVDSIEPSEITKEIKQAVKEEIADYTSKGVLINDAIDKWIENVEDDLKKGRIKFKDIKDYKAAIEYAKTLKTTIYKKSRKKSDIPFYEQNFTPNQQKEMIELGANVEQIIKKEEDKEQKAFLKNPEFLKNYLGYVRFKKSPEGKAKAKEREAASSFMSNVTYGMFSSIPSWLQKKLAVKWIKLEVPEAKRVTASMPYSSFDIKLTFDDSIKEKMVEDDQVRGGKIRSAYAKSVRRKVEDVISLFNSGYRDSYSDYPHNYRYFDNVYFQYKNFDKISGLDENCNYQEIQNNYMQSFLKVPKYL